MGLVCCLLDPVRECTADEVGHPRCDEGWIDEGLLERSETVPKMKE